jgi:HSP20 family protein
MMEKPKRSFFDRLTGVVNMDHEHDEDTEETEATTESSTAWMDEDNAVGQLNVDVYQTPDAIYIKAFVAGVKPEDLDISITRDLVTINGKRLEDTTIKESDHFLSELYWGEFARSIVLPAEIEADEAEASERHGLLVIKLPKIDKDKQTRLRVKAN